MSTVKIFYNSNSDFWFGRSQNEIDTATEPDAIIQAPAGMESGEVSIVDQHLNFAYGQTQSVDFPWTLRSSVLKKPAARARSTMVADIFELETENGPTRFVVDSCGFTPFDDLPRTSVRDGQVA